MDCSSGGDNMQLQSAIISNKAIARVIVDITSWDFTRAIITMIYLIYTHASEYFTDLLPQECSWSNLIYLQQHTCTAEQEPHKSLQNDRGSRMYT